MRIVLNVHQSYIFLDFQNHTKTIKLKTLILNNCMDKINNKKYNLRPRNDVWDIIIKKQEGEGHCDVIVLRQNLHYLACFL